MEVSDLRIGMYVRVCDIDCPLPLVVSAIVKRSGEYYAELYDDTDGKSRLRVVDKLIPVKPVNSALTWQDIRSIVILADSALEYHSKKDLVRMGEEGYYKDVLEAYEAEILGKSQQACAANPTSL